MTRLDLTHRLRRLGMSILDDVSLVTNQHIPRRVFELVYVKTNHGVPVFEREARV